MTENVKARVLAALSDRPLSNQEIREITQMNRNQVVRLMGSLRDDGLVELEQRGRGSYWRLKSAQ